MRGIQEGDPGIPLREKQERALPGVGPRSAGIHDRSEPIVTKREEKTRRASSAWHQKKSTPAKTTAVAPRREEPPSHLEDSAPSPRADAGRGRGSGYPSPVGEDADILSLKGRGRGVRAGDLANGEGGPTIRAAVAAARGSRCRPCFWIGWADGSARLSSRLGCCNGWAHAVDLVREGGRRLWVTDRRTRTSGWWAWR